MMRSKQTKQMVTAAALLALTLVFQNIRVLTGVTPVSTYIIGSLVNLCLILAVSLVNVWAGLMISVAAPVVAALQVYAAWLMVPAIMLGSAVLVLIYALIALPGIKKTGAPSIVSWGIAGVLAAVAKFCIIAAGMALMLSSKQSKAFGVVLGTAAAQQFQQLVTALIAMVLAYLIFPRLKKALQ